MALRAVKGIEVNDDTVAFNIIKEVGIGGEYVTSDHTLKHFKTEFHRCPLFNYSLRDTWEEEGAKNMNAKAREKAISLLKEHNPEPLDESIVKEMKKIIKHAEKEAT
jgi:trimethylamine--corrinoid protein Co-methyltransferase